MQAEKEVTFESINVVRARIYGAKNLPPPPKVYRVSTVQRLIPPKTLRDFMKKPLD